MGARHRIWGNFYVAAHELSMNAPSSRRSDRLGDYALRDKGTPTGIMPKTELEAVSRVTPLLARPISSRPAGSHRARGPLSIS